MTQPFQKPASGLFIGLMTGTSLDGLDAVLVDFAHSPVQIRGSVTLDYPPRLKQEMLALQAGSDTAGVNELHRSRVAAIELAQLHAHAVAQLLARTSTLASQVVALGAHGQTVRHAPHGAQGAQSLQDGAQAYTVQLLDAATLAEATGCTVVSDFRSRDIAAGGQGAPLVPAFHAALCGVVAKPCAVLNIGGFANATLLHADGTVQGLDTGPGNVLMDAWALEHLGTPYDAAGTWAARGTVHTGLLSDLLAHPYFHASLPKSTGREAFDLIWLRKHLQDRVIHPADVQATLCALTARSIAQAITQYQIQCQAVYVCGGGAYNAALMGLLQTQFSCPVRSSEALGVAPQHMEALAFAWLARQCLSGLAGNVPSVTGARGARVLGTISPAGVPG